LSQPSKPSKQPKAPRPSLKSLLLCDQIIHEAGTSKKSLIGVFHNITAAQFPCTHPMLSLYASLTDAAGAYQVEVRLVHLATQHQIARAPLPIMEVRDRLAPAEICVQLQLIEFPEPGKYEIQLSANGEDIGGRDFTVTQAQMPPGQDPPGPLPGPGAVRPGDDPPDRWSPPE
jgi:hypothetical protein